MLLFVGIQVSVFLISIAIIPDDSKPISESKSVIAIYNEDWGLRSFGKPKLLFCAWDDGQVVWSSNRTEGGPPFLTAKVEPKLFSATLSRLKAIGFFDLPKLKESNFGPDSRFTTILIRDADKELKMESWHELFEEEGRLIATERGVSSLSGRKLLTALNDEPASYLVYRLAWLEARLAAANLIPAAGTPTNGNMDMQAGIAKWVVSEHIERKKD